MVSPLAARYVHECAPSNMDAFILCLYDEADWEHQVSYMYIRDLEVFGYMYM